MVDRTSCVIWHQEFEVPSGNHIQGFDDKIFPAVTVLKSHNPSGVNEMAVLLITVTPPTQTILHTAHLELSDLSHSLASSIPTTKTNKTKKKKKKREREKERVWIQKRGNRLRDALPRIRHFRHVGVEYVLVKYAVD